MKKLVVAAIAVLAAVAIGAWYATRIPSSPFDSMADSGPVTPVEQAEYVTRLADCVACHSVEGGQPFAGGLEMGTPLGSIFATNITPDPETGIGNYTLAEFDNAVRRGVAKDGHRLYPAMPYPSYAKMSDDDVKALYDYFMHYVKPVKEANRESDIEWPLNMRWPLEFWNFAFLDTGAFESDQSKDEPWNRGAYLVQGAGHCGSCHTPRGFAIQEAAMDESSGDFLAGALLDGWYAPSLRNDHNVGLGRWNEEDIVAFLKKGRNQHGIVFGSMMEAFNNSTQYMTDDDLAGIAVYLKSLPGNEPEGAPKWAYDETTTVALNSGDTSKPGAALYLNQCGFCHGRDGKGRGEFLPPLAGASSMLADESASVINVMLNGAGRVVSNGVPDSYRMPPFRVLLTDRQIADIATFVRSSWGNNGTPVTEEQVRELRDRTDPMSDEVIVLKMR